MNNMIRLKVVYKAQFLLIVEYGHETELINIIRSNGFLVCNTSSVNNYLSTFLSLEVMCTLSYMLYKYHLICSIGDDTLFLVFNFQDLMLLELLL